MPSGNAIKNAISATRATSRISRFRRRGMNVSPKPGAGAGSTAGGSGSGCRARELFAGVLPARVLPEEKALQPQLLDMQPAKCLKGLALFAVAAQMNGVGGYPVDVVPRS